MKLNRHLIIWTLQDIARGAPPPDKRLLEHYFVYACIWAMGGCLLVDNVHDYQTAFSKWWVIEWKAVTFPEKASQLCDLSFKFSFKLHENLDLRLHDLLGATKACLLCKGCDQSSCLKVCTSFQCKIKCVNSFTHNHYGSPDSIVSNMNVINVGQPRMSTSTCEQLCTAWWCPFRRWPFFSRFLEILINKTNAGNHLWLLCGWAIL